VESFEDLDLGPELVEALASEGIERPTPLQEAAVPVLRKGNNAVLAAGPGSGVLVAWAAPLLERVAAGQAHARVLVLEPDRDAALRVAESVARLARHTGHSVAALGSSWVLHGHAQVLVGTPEEIHEEVRAGRVSLDALEALVVDGAAAIERLAGLEVVERLLPFVPSAAQRIVAALPLTPGIRDFAERHLRRAVTVPPPYDPEGAPTRGELAYRVVTEPVEAALVDAVDALLEGGARHVLVFTRGEDRAADIGDHLTLRGYVAGAPGDEAVPVWLGVDALEARAALESGEDVAVVSCDVPPDADTLDRRHGISGGGLALVLPREQAHLRDVARRAGYTLKAAPARPAVAAADALRRTHEALEEALESEDIAAYLVALEPLFERHDPAEIAAAAVALLRRRAPAAPAGASAAVRADAGAAGAGRGSAPTWAKLFLSVGSRDGLTPGDLLGAVTGEANVQGSVVGRIDIRESHTLLEVHSDVAPKVIAALNGITLKGRAVRADFDRPRGRGGPPAGPRRPRTPRPERGRGPSGPAG